MDRQIVVGLECVTQHACWDAYTKEERLCAERDLRKLVSALFGADVARGVGTVERGPRWLVEVLCVLGRAGT